VEYTGTKRTSFAEKVFSSVRVFLFLSFIFMGQSLPLDFSPFRFVSLQLISGALRFVFLPFPPLFLRMPRTLPKCSWSESRNRLFLFFLSTTVYSPRFGRVYQVSPSFFGRNPRRKVADSSSPLTRSSFPTRPRLDGRVAKSFCIPLRFLFETRQSVALSPK